MRVKKVFVIFLVLLFLISLRIATYSFPNTGSRSNPAANGLYDYKGLIHVHTTYSDGAGTAEEVAETADRAGIDFLITTDHNTLQPMMDQKEGWYHQLLLLNGEEIRMDVKEYALALGISREVQRNGRDGQAVVDEIQGQGGMAFISHPIHPRHEWKDWGMKRMTGMEIIDASEQWEGANPFAVLWALMTYPLNSSYAFLNLFNKPRDVLAVWDKINQTERMVGIYSVDLHGQIRIRKGKYIRFPPMEKVMPLATNHLLLPEPFQGDPVLDKKMVYEGIREGHLYFSIDLLGDPTGFLFQGTTGNGGKILMGDELTPSGPVTLTASLGGAFQPDSYRIVLIKDGEVVSESSTSPLVFEATDTGVYRVEVEIKRRSPFFLPRSNTWIYSNPIYLRGKPEMEAYPESEGERQPQ